MARDIEIRARAEKELSKIPKRDAKRIAEAIPGSQEELEDLRAIREARSDPKNQKGRPFLEAAKEHGWVK